LLDYVLLVAGIACAAAGGDLFVRGAVGLARAGRVSDAVIGATVAAFATSSPELAVAISAASDGTPQIALGDALGSNVVNVALILGLALLLGPIQGSRGTVRRDFPVALAVPAVTAVLCLDGELSGLEGAALMLLFVGWLGAVMLQVRDERRAAAPGATGDGADDRLGRAALLAAAGLVLLAGAGELIVNGAHGIARAFGVSEFVIGAAVVAVGTSVPELSTAVAARLRGHHEIGLGAVLGSNIFNGLWIVPVAAVLHPIRMAWSEVAVALAFGALALALVYPPRSGLIARWRGVLLLASYCSYLAVILLA
jgi:cation:H+ antiporter